MSTKMVVCGTCGGTGSAPGPRKNGVATRRVRCTLCQGLGRYEQWTPDPTIDRDREDKILKEAVATSYANARLHLAGVREALAWAFENDTIEGKARARARAVEEALAAADERNEARYLRGFITKERELRL